MEPTEHELRRYFRPGFTSTTNCPGCGNGIAQQAILRAIHELEMELKDFIFVSGIGCAAFIPSPYFNTDMLHTTHGRAIAFALGIKVNLPEKKVVVVSGDGDLAAIGGNHLIQNARRNLDIMVICLNNRIYGMTGGQAGPTTPAGLKTMTTPYGTYENPFDISNLVIAAGASYVARWTTYHPRQLAGSIKTAITKKGFSFIEVISQCPVQFGKRTGAGSAVEMLYEYKEKAIHVREASKAADPQALQGRIVVGELANRELPGFMEGIQILNQKARGTTYEKG